MLRNVLILAALLALAGAGCGGDGAPEDEGVRFAVYASEEQIGDRVDEGSLRCGPPRALCPPALINPTGTYRYEPQGEPALDAAAVAEARVGEREEGASVVVDLTVEGARAFSELTKRLADEGREAGRNRHAAIVVGDEIVALAAVDYEQYPQGIQTTNLQFFAADEADARAIVTRINGG